MTPKATANADYYAHFTATAIPHYKFTQGSGSEYTKETAGELLFTVKCDPLDTDTFKNFTGLEIDGKPVDPADYSVKSGSIRISLKSSCLDNLTNGKHSLKAVFKDGDTVATFVIKSAATPTPTSTAKPTAKPTAAPAVSIKLDKNESYLICGKTLKITASIKNTTTKISWKSSNTAVAVVDGNGKVTAKKAGATTITATVSGKSASCKLTVLYKDVTDHSKFWFKPVNYLTAKGTINGYDNGTVFEPAKHEKCTRAQMVTFIWRLKGKPEPKNKTCKFSDVKKTDYFYKACIWGNENHIVEGYKDGTFGPKIICARKHAVTFLWRLAGKPAPKSSSCKFKDVKKSDYFYNPVLWATEKKILAGYSDSTFRPNNDCLRRQMATFLYKFDIYT